MNFKSGRVVFKSDYFYLIGVFDGETLGDVDMRWDDVPGRLWIEEYDPPTDDGADGRVDGW
jgi:hypothetical protein